MQELDDIALLRQYAESASEAAFATIVNRHVNQVYSVALRHTRNPHDAGEITQAVFVILAGKSRQLDRRVILSGWLYQTARLTSQTFIRSQIRRTHREQEAHMQTVSPENEDAAWRQIAPLLDDAMGHLNETDRHAVGLRFFDGKSLREVGTALGTGEDAAKMRVNRALEKLRKYFARRGVSSTTAVIAGAMSTHSVQAAPAGLAKMATALAVTKGAAASSSTLTLSKGVLKLMAWTKVKTIVTIGVVVLLAAATPTVSRQLIEHYQIHHWRAHGMTRASIASLDRWTPQVWVAPAITKDPHVDGRQLARNATGKLMGRDMEFSWLLRDAYQMSEFRMIFNTDPPAGHYDFLANLPGGSAEALQNKISQSFKQVTVRREWVTTNVWLLTLAQAGKPGFAEPTTNKFGATQKVTNNKLTWLNQSLTGVDDFLEDYFAVPIIDQTGITGRHNISIQWNDNWWFNGPDQRDGLKQVIFDQLGLKLVPTNMPLEMLVVDKAP